MSDLNSARRQFKIKLGEKQTVSDAIPALMGRGDGTVAVPNQAGMVYIRVGNEQNYGTAFNNRVSPRDDLPVFVGYDTITDPDRRLFQVLSIRQTAYVDSGSTPIPAVGPHHETHEYGGGDDVYVEWRRIMGLRVGRPAGTMAGVAPITVTVDPGYIYRGTTWILSPVGFNTTDLRPAWAALAGTQARLVLISLDSTGAIVQTAGGIVASPAVLTITNCPTPPVGNIPLAAIRLFAAQTTIQDTPSNPDIIDLRFPTYATMGTHSILSVTHNDTTPAAIVRGDIVTGQGVAPLLTRLALGGITGSVVTRNATDVLWSTFALAGTAAQTYTFPAAGGTVALLNAANSFTLINPLTTIAESWIGPSATTGVYFRGGFVGIGTIPPAPSYLFHVRAADGISDNSYAAYISNEEATVNRNNGLWINAGSSASDYNVRGASIAGATLWSVTGAGKLSYVEADWTGGNVIYVPLAGDIQTYINAATAGDTLILASGEYVVTSTITVNKQLNIMGQGNAGFYTIPYAAAHGTIISSATAGVVAFQINASNVRIAHLSINLTGAASTGINTATDLTGLVFTNIDVIVTCTGLAQGFTVYGSNTVMRNLTFYITSSNTAAWGFYLWNDSSTTINATVDAYSVTGTVKGAGATSYGFVCENINDANTLTMNLLDCSVRAVAGAGTDIAVASISTTTNNSTVNCFLCTLDGANYDAYQNGTNVLAIGGSVLVNNLVFGTVTYRAAMSAGLGVFSTSAVAKQITAAGIGLDHNAATGNFTLWLSPANLTANRRVIFPDADMTISAAAGGTGTSGRVAQWGAGNTLTTANIIGPAANVLTLTATAASTLALAVSAGKTLTLTATDNSGITFTDACVLTIPTAGAVTAALLGTANVFTAIQAITSTTADQLKINYDANNYAKASVSSAGLLTITTLGAGALDSHIALMPDGYVGIGTIAPGNLLHILGTASTYITIGSSGANNLDRGISFNDQAGAVAGYITLVPNTVATNSVMNFYVGGGAAGDKKMLVLDNGNVSIGPETAPPSNLYVSVGSATLTQNILTVHGGGGGGAFGFSVQANNGDVIFQTNHLTYNSSFPNGNLSIGTTTADTRLDIDAGAIEIAEMTAPVAGAANTVRIYAVDNGAGKTQLMALFSSGAAQQLAIQP